MVSRWFRFETPKPGSLAKDTHQVVLLSGRVLFGRSILHAWHFSLGFLSLPQGPRSPKTRCYRPAPRPTPFWAVLPRLVGELAAFGIPLGVLMLHMECISGFPGSAVLAHCFESLSHRRLPTSKLNMHSMHCSPTKDVRQQVSRQYS